MYDFRFAFACRALVEQGSVFELRSEIPSRGQGKFFLNGRNRCVDERALMALANSTFRGDGESLAGFSF